MTTTTSCTTSTSSTASAAEQARIEAERAAAEARRQAEAARKQAEAAQHAQQAAMEARKQAQQTQAALQSPKLKPAERVDLQSRLERQTQTWKTAHEQAVTANAKAQDALVKAREAQHSLRLAAPQSSDRFDAIAAKNRQTMNQVMGKVPAGGQRERFENLQAQVAFRKVASGTKPTSQWLQADAAGFTGRLADQLEKASPAVQQRLLQMSAPSLKHAAQMLGDAGNGDGDESSVKALAASFSRIGNALPEQQAQMLAYGVAEQIDDDSEQHFMDDGFQQYIDGGGSSKFRDLVAGALDAQGKGDARDELTEDGAGGGFSLGGALGDVGGFLGDVASAAPGAVWDGFNAAADGSGAVLNAGGDALEFAHDHTAGIIPDQVSLTNPLLNVPGVRAAQDAIGLPTLDVSVNSPDLLHSAGDTVANLPETMEAAYQATQYRAAIDGLGKGDTFMVGAGGHVDFDGLRAQAAGSLSVARGDDGYTVTVGAEFGGGVGGRLGEGAEFGGGVTLNAGASLELKYDTAQEAKHACDVLMASAASAVVPPAGLVGQVTGATDAIFGASPADLPSLAGDISAVQVQANVAGQLDGELGAELSEISGRLKGQVQGALKVELADDGSPEAVVLSTRITGGASGTALRSGKGVDSSEQVSATLEQRFSIRGGFDVSDVLDPANLGNLVEAGPATLKLEGLGQGGTLAGAVGDVTATESTDQGLKATLSATGNPLDLIRSGAVQSLLGGDLRAASQKLTSKFDVSGTLEQYDTHTVNGAIELEEAGTGGGVYINSGTQDVADRPLVSFSGDDAQVRRGIREMLARIG